MNKAVNVLTVKDLKEILNACNEDAVVYISGEVFGTMLLAADDIFQEYSQPKGENDEYITTDVIIRVP